MINYIFIEFVLALFFVCYFRTMYHDYKQIKNAPMRLFILAILAMAFKSSWGIMFYGLEYEDAYAFAFSARQFANNIYSSTFLVDGISVGSIDNPVNMGCYGGHFITFPVYLSNFIRLLGYSEPVMAWVQLLTIFMVMVVLSLFETRPKRWLIAPIIYCLAPIMNVFGTTMLGETFSSLACITFIYFVVKRKNLFLALIALFLALLCKRENLILLIVPTLYSIKDYLWRKGKDYTVFALNMGCYIMVCVLYFICIKNVFAIEALESIDLRASTFSLAYFVQLFPVFMKALLGLRYFGIIFYMLVIAIVYQTIKRTISFNQTVLVFLFLGYLLLYTSHYRGYGFVHGLENVSEFGSFRYFNNFCYLIPIILSGSQIPSMMNRKLIVGLLSILLIGSIYITFDTRRELHHVEYENNFKECGEVTDILSKTGSRRYVIITDKILTYQVKMPSWFSVCDIRDAQKLNPKAMGFDYYMVYGDDFSYLEKRYGIKMDKNRITRLKQLSGNRYLYKYRAH